MKPHKNISDVVIDDLNSDKEHTIKMLKYCISSGYRKYKIAPDVDWSLIYAQRIYSIFINTDFIVSEDKSKYIKNLEGQIRTYDEIIQLKNNLISNLENDIIDLKIKLQNKDEFINGLQKQLDNE